MLCIMFITSKSAAICSRSIGYCNLTATVTGPPPPLPPPPLVALDEPSAVPSLSAETVALCTCARDAAAIGCSSMDLTNFDSGLPSSSAATDAT